MIVFYSYLKKIVLVLFIIFLSSCKDKEENNWYPFNSSASVTIPGEIGMADWLDKPAGKHGFLTIQNDEFRFENGTPIKFWGVNICSERPYVDHQTAEKWTNYLAKYGVNSVRFHKHTQYALKGEVSTKIDPGLFDNYDYFQNQLRQAGIYYGWSPIYGHKPLPGDSARLLAYNEIANAEMNSHLSNSTIGLVNFSEDLQDLHIELIVNMLNHKNPYSGLRYADDPALAFVEFQNEDNIYFATTEKMLDLCPTYKKLLTDKFVSWLRNKYDSHQGLINVWGEEAFEWGKEVKGLTWNLDSGNITPVASHGIYNYEYLESVKNDKNTPIFLLDMAVFLFEQQMHYYQRMENAIRETGYEGPLVSSCWQAGAGVTHFFNLYSDFRTGIIDRHNYFGGGTGHKLKAGEVKNQAMVDNPGSGLLSTGYQVVKDAPFQLSEWLSLSPNEWIAEASPLIAVYGLGLQGWDGSFSFASNSPDFSNRLESANHGVYNVESPLQVGLYPALARMIYRGDVKEGVVIGERNVHPESLAQGKIGFVENVKQDGDQKEISGLIPIESLAIGKVVVDFTNEFQETKSPNLKPYINDQSGIISASNNQLKWKQGPGGYVTVNTKSTVGFIGFNSGEEINIGELSLQISNPFAVILITCLNKEDNLNTADKILITTVARARNTGMIYNTDKTELLNPGEPPLLMEAVNFNVKMAYSEDAILHILDHSGAKTGRQRQINTSDFTIDGTKAQTLYYLIERKN